MPNKAFESHFQNRSQAANDSQYDCLYIDDSASQCEPVKPGVAGRVGEEQLLPEKSLLKIASNESVFQADGTPPYLNTHAQIEAAGMLMSDAPLDLPLRQDAFLGLSVALQQLDVEISGVGIIAKTMREASLSQSTGAAQGATVLSLSRRKGLHLLFGLLREVGLAAGSRRELDPSLLRTVGAWCLRRLMIDYQPSSEAIANVRRALLLAQGAAVNTWSPKAQARCLLAALRGLKQAIAENKKAAEGYGLSKSEIWNVQSRTAVECFNHAFRRRVENLIDFSTANAIAGAGGYGTLAAGSLLVAGEELLSRAVLGDLGALLICIEAITHLPSKTALQVPVQTCDTPPDDALAWLDIKNGKYCQILYRLKERGGKQPPGTGHLYEEANCKVTVLLPPPIKNLLVNLQLKRGNACSLADLLGPVGHHPRTAVLGNGAYRVTSRRIQESIPALLLQGGAPRWPVALATNSQFLTTRGRRAYGVCRITEIQNTINRAYGLLGWPTAAHIGPDELVGSLLTPKAASITTALQYLCDRADAWSEAAKSQDDLVKRLNTHAEWLAMFLSLTLALREWQVYKLKASELLIGEAVRFDDKDVHEYDGPGIPVCFLLKSVVAGWFSLCQVMVNQLDDIGSDDSHKLANRIRDWLSDTSSPLCFFNIDPVGRLHPVGHGTWILALPQNIRLVANFARHFWPLRLMDLGIEQLAIDVFMRHQFDDLTPGSSYMLKTPEKVLFKLRGGIDRVLTDLKIQVPMLLKVQKNA